MNVLFLSQIVPYPPHGGVLQRGYFLLRELGARARVHLLAFVHPDVLRTPAAIEESRSALREFCAEVEFFPLWAKRSTLHKAAALGVSAVSPRPFAMIAHRSDGFRAAVQRVRAARQLDIVHVDTIALQQFLPATTTASDRAATVLTHHNIESMLMRRRAEVESRALARGFLQRETAKLARCERDLSPTFDVNVVMSPNDGEILTAMAPQARVAVVPNGVNVDYFRPERSRETPALIYTGGMNMFANKDAVLFFLREVWPAVKAAVPGVHFYAVGQDPPPELTAIAAGDSQVTATGYVDDIRPYVAKAAVYVVPLRVGGGTRLKVLDAMASGKALVSTAIGCEGIAVRDGEHLVIADAPRDFAAATVALLQSPERRRALGDAARTLVERQYAWSVIGDQLMAAYGQALAARRSRR